MADWALIITTQFFNASAMELVRANVVSFSGLGLRLGLCMSLDYEQRECLGWKCGIEAFLVYDCFFDIIILRS